MADGVEHIKTVLGSCVAVCLWDKKRKKGAMNHFIYPKATKSERNARYGNLSLAYMLKLMTGAGSNKSDLIAHIIGGADNSNLSSNVGKQNVRMAQKFLKKHNIQIVSEDVGGSIGKKVVFNTVTGEILVHKCMAIRESDWYG